MNVGYPEMMLTSCFPSWRETVNDFQRFVTANI
jgi:hypothetical protein